MPRLRNPIVPASRAQPASLIARRETLFAWRAFLKSSGVAGAILEKSS